MKIITLLLATLLLSLSLFAQVPDQINYQAIIRDTNGTLVRSQQIRMKISILVNSDTGTPVYTEIHDAESNENGLVSLEIGNGRTTDVFTAIDWSAGIYFLKTETDPEGNSNFTISGTSQILSVPYAFHAQTVENDKVDDADSDPNNEIQTLSVSGNDLSISDGNTVSLPAGVESPWQASGNNIFFNSGNVGIGIENPQSKLHVHGDGLFMGEKDGGLFIAPGENEVFIGYRTPSSIHNTMVLSWGKIKFDGKFTVLNGNTGIGTDNPEHLLHLAGANPRILIEASSSNPEINFKNDGDIPTSIWSIYKNGSTSDLHFFQNGNKLTLQNNTGNVGIGTSTPQGRLDVNGAIYQRGGVLHADYVFEADYQLESIEEHARFMWKNKHLPAIPKATTDDNGDEIVEVGSHRKGIVEELEKAHIYISQLEKAIQEQATLIKNQESRLEQLEVLVKKSMSN